MKENIQPDWLKKYVMGYSNSHKWKVYLEGEKYAIINSPGESYWSGLSMKYGKSSYTLIKKDGKNYWPAFKLEVHEGRIKKEDKMRLQKILKDYDEGF